MRFLSLGSLATIAVLAGSAARAEVRAVLVGAGDYLTLEADLKGPANDVRLMAETLVLRGVAPSNLTVLTSDPSGLPSGTATGQPLRAEIMAALEAAAANAASGDTVVFYFSGHGAQAPDMSGDEGGGHDELLLPVDVSGWKGEIGAVENAILDDELQVWAQSALSRGVRVVGLIDACYSATGFRALGGQGVARVIDEAALGIPDDVPPVVSRPAPPLEGDFVFLYSSQSDQRSFEYPLADGTTWHGEFTLRLAEVLRTAPDASWAQVLTAATGMMAQGPARQMPEGEGPLLEARVFGRGQGAARFPVAGGRLAAGLLQGLTTGTEIALYADPAGGDPLAILTLGKVTARDAIADGKLPAGAAWAEVVSLPPPEPLTLAVPVFADPADDADYAPWLAELPAPGADPDLIPVLTGGVVALAGPDGVLDPLGPGSSPRIRPEPGERPADAVTRVLQRAAHGLRLRQLLSGAAGRSLTGKAPLAMAIDHRPASPGCDTVGEAVPFDPALPVAPCDQLWLTVTNASGKAQDLSVLYFAADFEVQPIWPRQNLSNRLAPGESARVGLQIVDTGTPGLEEIWVLAVPAEPDAPRIDLTRLVTPEMTRAYAGAPDPMSLWLESQMDPDAASRGFSAKPAALAMIRQVLRLKPGPDGLDRIKEQ